MTHHIKRLLSHPLISGSSVVLVGSFIMNIISYGFNLLMSRFLSVSDYGLLITLTSLFSLFGIFSTTFSGIFTKFAATYHGAENIEGFNAMLYGGLKFTSYFSFVLLVCMLLTLPFTAQFLHVTDMWLLVMIIFFIVVSIMLSLSGGIFQGQLRFYLLSFLNILGPLLKIGFGVLFLFLGFKVFGLTVAMVLSGVIPLIISSLIIFRKTHQNRVKANESKFLLELRGYGVTFFLASFGITIFTSLDVVLVRHFFSATVAGQYAALSLMGKAIFYLTSPIYAVFFPLIVQKKERQESLLGTLLLATGIIVIASGMLSFVYFFFPNLVLAIFYPSPAYRILGNYLGLYSIYILIFSLDWLLSSYFLSIGKTGIYKLNILCAILFIVCLSLFHATLYQVIGVLFFVALVLLGSLLIYFRYHGRD